MLDFQGKSYLKSLEKETGKKTLLAYIVGLVVRFVE